MTSTALRDRVLSVLGATLSMLALPAACFTLRSIGPASRAVFYEYLPLEELGLLGLSIVVGAGLGWGAAHWLRAGLRARGRLPYLRLVGFAVLGVWVVLPQLRAFPASASVAEREAWARSRFAQYAPLTRVVGAVPEVRADVGEIIAIAPTANDQHSGAREMNGDDMRFTLDVVGSRGAGVFYVDCTLDAWRVYDWRAGRWSFGGRQIRIERAP